VRYQQHHKINHKHEEISKALLSNCSFPDLDVRHVAVNWLRSLGSDELVDYLPQLVQALKHETWEASPLAYFLLERALTSPRVAHHLYWLLAQTLPGEFPQVQF
jgi:phosphatidylinositol-4-phosphate 3-kinase